MTRSIGIPPTLGRVLAALPDAATAIAFACTWVAPLAWCADALPLLMMTMLLEFLVVHSGGFIGITVLSESMSRRAKSLAVLGFGVFYLMFAAAFGLSFHSWWPVASFSWLIVAKFAQVWLSPLPREDESMRFMALWALSVLAYLGSVFAGAFLPIPRFGITPEVVAGLHLDGGGLWLEHPETVIASGVLYFSLLALGKWLYRPEWLARMRVAPST